MLQHQNGRRVGWASKRGDSEFFTPKSARNFDLGPSPDIVVDTIRDPQNYNHIESSLGCRNGKSRTSECQWSVTGSEGPHRKPAGHLNDFDLNPVFFIEP